VSNDEDEENEGKLDQEDATVGKPVSESLHKFAWGPGDMKIYNPPEKSDDSE
jgi:hypothetical protein